MDTYTYTRVPIPAKSSDTLPYTFTVPKDAQGSQRTANFSLRFENVS
ncbi:MAG: hypothetical protein OZ914_10940 [Anaerolineaceae bacterium]|nr:hypothetical protein [Anaerolineaceae bacterium]